MARHFPMNFCPVCATPLVRAESFGKIRPVCPHCNFVHFSDPKVAAVVVVERDKQVLLARRAVNPAKGKWAFPGGFVERGEDPRQAAVRECWEETGLEIQIASVIDVYQDQSGDVIVIAFAASLVGGLLAAGDDVDRVAFFDPDQLPELAWASTGDILALWRANREIPNPLPRGAEPQ